MNNNRRHYIKKEQKGQIIFVLAILLAVIIGLGWCALDKMNEGPVWKATESYPMANENIMYQTMLFGGGWD